MYSMNTSNLPYLRSFAACEAWANRWRAILTKRYHKMWGPNCVPLRNSRDRHMYLQWIEDGSDSRWACYLYSTPVLQFTRDGRMIVDVSYGTQSTRDFLLGLLPRDVLCVKRTSYGYVYDVDRHDAAHCVTRKHEEKWGYAVVFDSRMNVLNPQEWDKTRVVANREVRKQIMTKLKPFLVWYKAMTLIDPSNMSFALDMQFRPATHGNGLHAVCDNGAIERMVESLMEDDAHEDIPLWRKACWEAFIGVRRGSYFWTLDRSHIASTSGRFAKGVRNKILEHAYDNYGGYKEITTRMKQGEI